MRDIVILGMSYPGLFLARKFAGKSYDLHCVGRNEDEVGLYSKYGKKYTADSGQEIEEIIKAVASKRPKVKPIVFITSGAFLDIILEEIPEIANYADLRGANLDTIRVLNTKTEAYLELGKAGIRVPKTFPLKNIGEGHEISFPVIVKWNTLKASLDDVDKIKVIDDAKDLEDFLSSIDREKLDEHIIIQEYISDAQEWGYGAYYENGKEIANIMFWQKRQYPTGIACCAVEVRNSFAELIRKELKGFLSKINYSGFIEFDVLVNFSLNQYYVLDVNPRPWGSLKIIGKKYPNLGDYILGETSKLETKDSKKPICFIRMSSDIIALFKEFKRVKKFGVILDVLRDYTNYSCTIDEFDKMDLGPILGVFKKGVRQLGTRRKRVKIF